MPLWNHYIFQNANYLLCYVCVFVLVLCCYFFVVGSYW